MTEPNVDINSPTIQNLVNSVFFTFNNPSRSYNATSQLHHLIRAFCKVFGNEEKAEELFKIWKAGPSGVSTAKLEFKVLQKITNPGIDSLLLINGKKQSTGKLNELLEMRRMWMLDIFFTLCAEHSVEVPVQWDKFKPAEGAGTLPALGA